MDRPHDHGRTADEAESTGAPDTPDDDWVHELLAMTRPGVKINFPVRGLRDRVIPFQFDDFD